MSQAPINISLADSRLNGVTVKNANERSREAFDYMVKQGVETARRMGNSNVTEEQVRNQLRKIIEPTDRKVSEGGYKNRGRRPQGVSTADHIVIDENPNIKEI